MKIREATPADTPAIARVHVDTWRTCYQGIIDGKYLEELSYDEVEKFCNRMFADDQGSVCCYVATTRSGEIIGYAAGGPERFGDPDYQGELYSIYLRQKFQRSGTGLRLVQAVVKEFQQSNLHSMKVWALSANQNARRFYQYLGGKELQKQLIEIGGIDYEETSYGWSDTGVILSVKPNGYFAKKWASIRKWAQELKKLTYVVYLASRDPRTPWYAKLLAIVIAGYAFSPIDLIPDFIPILGYLDDLLLIPLGITLVLRMIPQEVLTEARLKAEAELSLSKPKSRLAAVVIIIIWILTLTLILVVVFRN